MIATAGVVLAAFVIGSLAGHAWGARVLAPIWTRVSPATWGALDRPFLCPEGCGRVHLEWRTGLGRHQIGLSRELAHAFARDLLELVLSPQDGDDECPRCGFARCSCLS